MESLVPKSDHKIHRHVHALQCCVAGKATFQFSVAFSADYSPELNHMIRIIHDTKSKDIRGTLMKGVKAD